MADNNQENRKAYWKANIRLMVVLLCIWFTISYLCGIVFVEELNTISMGGYKLGFWFEDYSADNWAVDGLQPYDPLAVENTLLLGNTTLDYNVYVITASAIYRY